MRRFPNMSAAATARVDYSEALDRLAARDARHRPLATYRLQFHAGFRFSDALQLVDYFSALGISHLYSSPIFKARAGSTHGYDITDHNKLNPELGTDEEFRALTDALKSRAIGLVLDIVPNHVGIGEHNPWWQDVLANGRSSRFAEYFDIDWSPLKPELENKVLLPVLGLQYGEELESGRIKLEFDGEFFVCYYDKRFPLDPFLAIGAPLKTFDMPPSPDHFGIVDGPGAFPDARQQLPLVIGDWIDYSGTLAKDALGDDYISAHTIIANLGVFTAPGYQPAYMAIEELLLGTAGDAIPGIDQEATNRIFVVGFTTDPSALVDVNAIDVNPCTGQESLRLLGTVDPASQPVRGRFRFHVLGGAFMPPTREMVVTSYDGTTPPSEPGGAGGMGRHGDGIGKRLRKMG